MRLARWCESTQGHYAWVFDNAEDSLVGQLTQASLFGVDVTEFLDNALTRAPVTLYLFHVIRQLLDGGKFVCWMDEFWKLLSDPSFEGFAKDGPKTWRKLNGVMCLATQSASVVLDSPISRTIIEQTPTKILFPNPDADAAEYIEGFGLSEREFKLIKEQIEPGSRQFLIKQGLLFTLFSFFTQYASLAANAGVLNMPAPSGSSRYFVEVTSVGYVLIPAALMMGSLLFLVRRWQLPFGAATVMFTVNALLMFVMRINFNDRYGAVVVAAALAGLIADVLILQLQPSAVKYNALRLFAFVVPVTYLLLMFAAIVLSGPRGLWWEIHTWLGVPFVAGTIGIGLSFLVVPPSIPEEV